MNTSKILIIFVVIFLDSCEKLYFNEKSDDPEYIFESYWKEVDRNFSFFSYLNLNWDSVYTVYKQKINQSTNPKQLYLILGEMTKLLKDGHSDLFSNFGTISFTDWYSKYPANQLPDIQSYFENYYNYHNHIYYGKIKSANLGYVYIKTFGGDTSEYTIIDKIISDFATTDGIIIDVRSNGGGNSINGTTIAKRFADSARYIFKVRFRNGPKHTDFDPWIDLYLKTGGKVHYSKPVAILTNRKCYSATGWFILEMASLPQVKVIGDTTGGGSAQPVIRELPNGWILRVSNSQRLTPEGRDDQYSGFYPDIPVWINNQDAVRGIDTILERAIKELTKK
jgi:hypothetical protein